MLWRDLKVWQIYGANTDVGKTVLSTILCKALARQAPPKSVLYLKPVSTGRHDEHDHENITCNVENIVSRGIKEAVYRLAKSPHIAAREMGQKVIEDQSLVAKVKDVLTKHGQSGGRYVLVETAGGVLSPGPSGSLQADLYRPLRLPTLLVGDSKLGGIGSTISAFESLHVRGYEVDSVILFDDPEWENFSYLKEHFAKHDIQTYSLPLPPPKPKHRTGAEPAMSEYYEKCSKSTCVLNIVNLLNHKHFSRTSKLSSLPSHADSIIWHPFRQHALRHNIVAIDSAHRDHFEVYNQETDPTFAQTSQQSSSSLSQIPATPSKPMLTPLYDASASWWTQGLGHGNPDLSLTAAHAAGRFGHVMFAHAVHQPAVDLCYNLLGVLENPRLSRVFFTDNGSTGMEVAVKMALRASCQRYGWTKDDREHPVGILGLKGSYHGDTIGVMNCSEPNTFNEKVDWYKPWGYWFDPPQVLMRKGRWMIDVPTSMHENASAAPTSPPAFASLRSISDFDSRSTDAAFYKSYITRTLKHLTQTQQRRFGALIIEPILMGAGGMIFVDPLFQRTLITAIREDPTLINPAHTLSTSTSTDSTDWTGLPLIADEVFTGLYRLGRASSSAFLSSHSNSSTTTKIPHDIAPDISVHAKLLTGGLLPLALTTASTSVFNTFLSDSKTDALLHGHSYTAHPIGCAVANKSLKEMKKLHDENKNWAEYRGAWSSLPSPSPSPSHDSSLTTSSSAATAAAATSTPAASTLQFTKPDDEIFSFFSPEFLTTLSHHPLVSGCFALGTVCALTMTSQPSSDSTSGSGGYTSTATASLQSRLLTTLDANGRGIHSRVLGDVLYVMTSLTTEPRMVRILEEMLLKCLDEEMQDQGLE